MADLESILAKRLPADGVGEAVLVARNGRILFAHGYGLADRERQSPTTPETRFRVGSVTKQFTTAAILYLSEKGKLSINDPLAKYFIDYPGGNKITLRQLLNHTSGLHNYTAHPDFLARVIHPIAPNDLIAWFRDDPTDFPPGDQFNYSNTNYVLLGQIVEKVAGMPLGDFLRTRFFIPLGMHDTGIWNNAAPPDHSARGYSWIDNGFQPAIDWDMSWAAGAGALYSTVGDLWHWTEALQSGRVLSLATLQTMTTEVIIPKNETLSLHYGMGLYHTEINWLPALGHNGELQGFLSSVMWFPEQKVTAVVLSNAYPAPAGTTPGEILTIATRAFMTAEIAAHMPKVNTSINSKSYSEYVGRYDYKSGIQEITVEDGRIFAQLTGQNKFEIFPSSADSFFFKVVDANIVFQRDEHGSVISISHTQNGLTFTAPKLPKNEIVALSNESLDAFVGQYQYGPTTILDVTRRGNQLYAQLSGQPEAPIFPKSDHEFFWEIVPASVEFVRGKDGEITNAIHHQNGLTFPAPKIK
jgi:CubicO group peptidase (beta-lactamase class C family)